MSGVSSLLSRQQPRQQQRDMSLSDRYPQRSFAARPKDSQKIIGERLDNFVEGQFADYNLSSILYAERTDDAQHVSMEVWSAPGRTKPTISEAIDKIKRGEGRPIRKGFEFGPSCALFTNHWVKVTLTIPADWTKYEEVQIIFDPSCEGLIYDESGNPIHALTGDFLNNRRVEHIIPKSDVKNGKVVRYIECSANHMSGVNEIYPPQDDKYYKLESADLVALNKEAWRLRWDFETLRELSVYLPEKSPLRNKAQSTANRVINAFKGTLESVADCRAIAEEVLGKEWESELLKARGKSGVDKTGTIWALGHCHIDTAWLWPWSVTQQKVARSWSTQLDLMERYPEHRFGATSAQQYKWLEQYYPQVFKRVQEQVRTGKFEVIGGTWVEMDTNMLIGESFCRQYLLGQRYFKSRFGKNCAISVLPDTFGYAANLPQIARLGGTTSFFTQKMSWNFTNEFPYTSFNWVGLDGSQLLTHMTAVVNYNSSCSIEDLRKGYVNHHNLTESSDGIIFFGNGDGGGGPNATMLERLRRARVVGEQNDASGSELPLVKCGRSLDDFFMTLREDTNNGEILPEWVGELYLEIHRGTYTSQAKSKLGNRKGEILLREVELFNTLATIYTDHKYPKEQIEVLWEDLCRNQFHDTITGTSIALVIQDVEEKYRNLFKKGNELIDKALAKLCPSQEMGAVTFLNTLPGQERREVVAKGKNGGFVVAETLVGGMCATVKTNVNTTGVKVEVSKDGFKMSNDSLSIAVKHGRITSILDLALKREIIGKGQNAGFNIYEDLPNHWDAWDVEHYTLQKCERLKFQSYQVIESNSLRSTVECKLAFGRSTATVQISLDALPASVSPNARSLIRFDTTVDWYEKHRFLKFELPTTVWSPESTYDAAFGVVRRPTHRNSSWEQAKFEVCAHKFADLSEFGFGVAILNDCKYGYDVQGNVMRLSLLRSPMAPDANCDEGEQKFAFAVYPHVGTYSESDVQKVAHAFNTPLRRIQGGEALAPLKTFPFVVEGAPNVMLETIKRGENDFDVFNFTESRTKTIILRLHEHMGGKAAAKVVVNGLKVSKASIVDIIEEDVQDVRMVKKGDGFTIDLDFTGFEVKTVRLTLA